MDDTMKAAIRAVKDAELAKRTAPAEDATATPGDAMDPAAGSTVSPQEPSQGDGIGDMLSGVANAGMETIGRLMRGEADPEFAQAVTGAETELDNTQADPNAEPSLHEKAVATMAAIPTGAVKAGYEAVEGVKSLAGIDPGPKSPERTKVESLDEALRGRTMAASLASSLSSFTVGLIGAGKLLGPLKGIAEGSKIAKTAYEVAKGATAGYFAMNPHEGRLSDIVQQFPSLENPVTAYLASDPEDTEVEGRLKNALEGVGMDVAAAAMFSVGLKAFKALRNGDKEAAKAAAVELDTVAKEVEVPPPAKPVSDDDVMAAIEGHPERPVEEAVDVHGPIAQAETSAPPPSAVAEQAAMPVSKAVASSTVDNIIAGTKADLKTVDEAGGVAAAINAGYRLEATTSFPWKRVVTGDDVDVLVENSLKQVRPELNVMRGGDVLHDVDVTASLKDIAKTYQADPQLILGELSQAGEAAVDSVKRMEAGHLIFRKMSLDVTAAVKKFNAGQFAEFGGEEAGRQEIKRRIVLMLEVYGQTQAIVSNAGRVIRRQRAEFDNYGVLLQEMGRVDDRQLFRTIEQMDGNPELIKQAIKPGFWRRVLEEATFSMRNGLLWLYPSHAFNVAGNVLITTARPVETAIGSIFLGKAGSPLMKRALREYVYTGAAVWDGFKAAADTFLEADSRLAPHSTDLINGAETSTHLHDLRDFEWHPVADAGDVWANAHAAFNYAYRNGIGLPSRLMGAQDSFFKTLRYRSLVQAEAHVEGVSQGLSGQGLKDYVASRLEKAFDETGKATDAKALREAQIVTLNQDLLPKTLGASISNARGVHPWLGLVLPYVKTPVNALRYSHKYTPALNLLQKEYREAFMGKAGAEEQARAFGQMSLGVLFMGSATLLAAQGKITGGGPKDPKLLRQLTEQGWKPYSYMRRNEDGTTTYIPFNRLDPVAMPFGIAADCFDGYRSGGDMETVMWACTLAVGRGFVDRGFTKNMQSALEAYNDVDGRGDAFLGRLASNLIPASSALRGYVNQDPYMREARDLMDSSLKSLPGYSEGLPIHRDAFGEPVLRSIGITSSGPHDVVTAENVRLILETGKGITPPSAVREGVDLRDITLEGGQNAFDRYQELVAHPVDGEPSLKEHLAAIIASEDYQELLDDPEGRKGSKVYALEAAMWPYREAAYRELVSQSNAVQRAILEQKYGFAAKAADKANGDKSASDRLMEALDNLR